MTQLLAYLTVFVAAAIPWLEVLVVVPAGIVAGLSPVPTALVGAAGNIATLVPLIVGGDRLRTRWRQRRGPGASTEGERAERGPTEGEAAKGGPTEGERAEGERADGQPNSRGRRARQVFDRFGLPGLAVVGPLVTGVHLAALAGLAAGAPRRASVLWLSGAVVVWSGVAALVTAAGLEAFVDPERLPSLFGPAASGS